MSFVQGQPITVRTFGWIQDPGKFENLKKVVATFYFGSTAHQDLLTKIIPKLVLEKDGKTHFIKVLSKKPLKLEYKDLVGTSFIPRSAARCNGILQAVLPGQRRAFQGNWPADNFLRWAHAIGFLSYDYLTDSFTITESGKFYVESSFGSNQEKQILTNALLSYPPVMRILNLLSDGSHQTKYELGKQFGFIGEAGFTTLPQNILLDTLSKTFDSKEKNKIKSDWDGSSDKYVRMICSWLVSLDLIIQEPKTFEINGKTESIGQAYKITNQGLIVRRFGLGISKANRIKKNIYWELFATKCVDRVYIRTRRSYVLKIIENANSLITLTDIKTILEQQYNLEIGIETIKDDIRGFINIGLNIEITDHGYKFKDYVTDFIIPELTATETKISDLLIYKEQCRSRLHLLSHEYLSLIDIAFDSTQNRLFEMQTINLLTKECGFLGKHLGGGRKPDGIIYRTEDGHGIIIDTKAYSKGYTLPISQADEMTRYIRENITRDDSINTNCWWENFPTEIQYFNYAFISSIFKGKIYLTLQRIALDTGVNGVALNVMSLLMLAEKIKTKAITYEQFYTLVNKNNEITID